MAGTHSVTAPMAKARSINRNDPNFALHRGTDCNAAKPGPRSIGILECAFNSPCDRRRGPSKSASVELSTRLVQVGALTA
jgi:hypothetical protein